MVSAVYAGRLTSVRLVAVGIVMSLVVVGCAEPGLAARQVSTETVTARQVSTETVTGGQREQLDHYRHLITDANSPRTRQYGAELMLKTGWPEAIEELRKIVEEGKDSAAHLAVAEAVAKVSNRPRDLIEPLIVLLGGSEETVRQAAGAALASYKDSGVATRLGELARDEEADFSQRVAAINALSRMTDKSAIDAMIVLLDDDNAEIGAKTVAALHAATGIDEGQDARAWKQWWQENRNKTRQQWVREVNASLTKRNKTLEEQLVSLQKRLGRTLQECYQLTPEPGRPALVLGWLKDPLEQVRILGLELATAAVKERRLLSDELAAQIRQMVGDPSSQVRKTVMVVLRPPSSCCPLWSPSRWCDHR
jgi:HEAT repeat protein